MRAAIRMPGVGDPQTHVEHLDELRSRLIVSVVAVGAAFAICFTQSGVLLRLIGRPLAQVAAGQRGEASARSGSEQATAAVAAAVHRLAGAIAAPGSGAGPRLRSVAGALRGPLAHASQAAAAAPSQRPVTLGIGEPFTTTVMVALLFSIALALPVLLVQLYGFLAPALADDVRASVRQLMAVVPFLFVLGAAFGYFVVLPATLHFLLTFDSGQFTVLVQASQYYRFAATTLIALGLLFQVPVAIVVLTRAGVVTAAQLRRNRRYAIAACVAIAALLPGEVVTMAIETVPLYVLFELGVAAAALVERRARRTTRPAAMA